MELQGLNGLSLALTFDLDDALTTSLAQLIAACSPDARRLLWMIAVANEPVTLGLLAYVWSGEGPEQHQLRQLKVKLDQ